MLYLKTFLFFEQASASLLSQRLVQDEEDITVHVRFRLDNQEMAGLDREVQKALQQFGDNIFDEKRDFTISKSESIDALMGYIGADLPGRVGHLKMGDIDLHPSSSLQGEGVETEAQLLAVIDSVDLLSNLETDVFLSRISYQWGEFRTLENQWKNFNKYHVTKKAFKGTLASVGGALAGTATGAALGFIHVNPVSVACCAAGGLVGGGMVGAYWAAENDASEAYVYRFRYEEQGQNVHYFEARYSDMRRAGDREGRSLPDVIDGFDRKHMLTSMRREADNRSAWFRKHFGEKRVPVVSVHHDPQHDRAARRQIADMFKVLLGREVAHSSLIQMDNADHCGVAVPLQPALHDITRAWLQHFEDGGAGDLPKVDRALHSLIECDVNFGFDMSSVEKLNVFMDLVRLGADVRALSDFKSTSNWTLGYTAIMFLASELTQESTIEHQIFFQDLVDNTSDRCLNARDAGGLSALDHLLKSIHRRACLSCVQSLIFRGAHLNHPINLPVEAAPVDRVYEGMVPLNFAARSGNLMCAQMLYDAGADLKLAFDSILNFPDRNVGASEVQILIELVARRLRWKQHKLQKAPIVNRRLNEILPQRADHLHHNVMSGMIQNDINYWVDRVQEVVERTGHCRDLYTYHQLLRLARDMVSGGMKFENFEISTATIDDPNKDVEFGQFPVQCSCPHCNSNVITFVEYEASWSAYILSFCMFILTGWLSFCLVPILWPLFKDVVHHCPRCLNVVETKSRIQCPKIEAQMMTFRFGNCACVLTRKYAIILGVLIFMGLGYLYISNLHLEGSIRMDAGDVSDRTWSQFQEDCGAKAYNDNPIRAVAQFEKHYSQRTFLWEGVVQRIREGLDVFIWKTKSILFVEMSVMSSLWARASTDIVIMFDSNLNDQVAELRPGNKIRFNATLFGLGRRGQPHVMHLWGVEQMGQADNIALGIEDLNKGDLNADQAMGR